MWFSTRLPAAAVLVLLLFAARAAPAQPVDVTGTWQTMRPSGRYDITLQQHGSQVDGTYHLGRIQGVMQGNVLVGRFSDIMTGGQIRLTFAPDGTFRGSATSGGPNANGAEPWSGRRVSGVAATPASVLAQRARLDQVFQAGGDYTQQASLACQNAFQATFARTQHGWATTMQRSAGSFAPALGAPQNDTVLEEVADVHIAEVTQRPLSQADQLNGWEFRGLTGITGTSARILSGGNSQDWQALPRVPFITCTYAVRNGQPTFDAVDSNIGVSLDRLQRPNPQ